jgi:hypothetical protein
MTTGSESMNVGESERLLSMYGAGLLTACGLLRGSMTFLALGAGLAYRGFTGHCHVYEALGQNTAAQDGGATSDRSEQDNEPSRVILSE